MAAGTLNSGTEGLIPGLPDDVSKLCLARISHGYEGVMQCVSKGWRDVFRGDEIGQIRAREGLSGDWLFVCTGEQFDGWRPCDPAADCWQAYDPAADRWHPLPPVPGFSSSTKHMGFCCVILRRRLVVLGGEQILIPDGHSKKLSIPTNHVHCFDPFFRKWIELPSMTTPRTGFICDVIDGCIVVMGGGSSTTESFDPETNTWEVLPEPSGHLELKLRMMLHNSIYRLLSGGCVIGIHEFVAYADPWNVTEDDLAVINWLHNMETESRLYGIVYKWSTVFSDYMREWWTLFSEVQGCERWPGLSYYGLMKLKGRLYLCGGVVRNYDLNIRDIVSNELSTVWYCDPSAGTPLSWHHARPLLGRGGRIHACATLQQE